MLVIKTTGPPLFWLAQHDASWRDYPETHAGRRKPVITITALQQEHLNTGLGRGDIPGLLQHVIVRSVARADIFLNGQELIKPASQKVRGFLRELKVFIKSCVALPTDIFIRRLNSKLRGWAQSYRQVVAKKVFGWVDYCVYHYLRKWMRHRHRNKTDAWLKRHYFIRVGMRSEFFAMSTNSHGEKQRLLLFKTADLPIRRHNKVTGAATPYDSAWSGYFKRRVTNRMAQRMFDRRFLSTCTLQRQIG